MYICLKLTTSGDWIIINFLKNLNCQDNQEEESNISFLWPIFSPFPDKLTIGNKNVKKKLVHYWANYLQLGSAHFYNVISLGIRAPNWMPTKRVLATVYLEWSPCGTERKYLSSCKQIAKTKQVCLVNNKKTSKYNIRHNIKKKEKVSSSHRHPMRFVSRSGEFSIKTKSHWRCSTKHKSLSAPLWPHRMCFLAGVTCIFFYSCNQITHEDHCLQICARSV